MRLAPLVLAVGLFGCGLVPKAKDNGPPKGTFTVDVSGVHLGSPFTVSATGETTLSQTQNHLLWLDGGDLPDAPAPSVQMTNPQFVLGGTQTQAQLDTYWGNVNVAPRANQTTLTFQFDDVLLNPFGLHGTFSGSVGVAGDPELYTFANGQFTAFADCTMSAYAGALDCGGQGGGVDLTKFSLPHTYSVKEPVVPPTYWNRCPAELEAVFIDPSTAGACADGSAASCLSTAAVLDGTKLQIGGGTPMPCDKFSGSMDAQFRCVGQASNVQASGCTWKVTALAGPSGHESNEALLLTASADAACALPSRFCGIEYPLAP